MCVNILIVDDQEAVCKTFQAMLEDEKHIGEIYVCHTLQEAYDILDHHPVQLVILDLFLTDTQELATLRMFKKAFPDLPVVVITGQDTPDLPYKCFKHGASDYLTKPSIDKQHLVRACLSSVARHRAYDDRFRNLEMAKTKDLLHSSRLLNAGIAHELRTPLQALLNCLELIKEEVLANCPFRLETCLKSEKVSTLIDAGLDRTEYAVKVLNSLSEYSKIASSTDTHLINVVPELKTIMKTLSFTDQFKRLDDDSFVLRPMGTGSCLIKINRVDFSQLVTNLCRNAVEAARQEDPQIEICVAHSFPYMRLSVIDNGKGVEPAFRDKIFEPYFSTKENPEGYNQGLGLTMVKDIVAAYGGMIDYKSKPGRTEFIVHLPCEHTN